MPQIDIKTQIIDRDELQRFLPAKAYRLLKFFENLASDVSSTIPDAISTVVTGPNGAVDNHVPVFDGVTGYVIRDSGVAIDELAPLDSPAFTGTPTAPTAAPGTSTTQIATTAFVDDAVTGGVKGPASATNNAIALFNGTTGKLIKDSAVLLSSLATNAGVAATYAPLASPALTGNPTAPTATVGDNDTSIATTAFVQAEFAARVSAGASFSAHNNGVAQSIPNSTWTKLTFSTEQYDVGSKFASSTWTPPAGRVVIMVGTVALPSVAATGQQIAIYKNGAEFKRGNQHVSAASSADVYQVTCMDIPNGTDTYELYVLQGTGASQNTFGGSALTYFQGTTIQA